MKYLLYIPAAVFKHAGNFASSRETCLPSVLSSNLPTHVQSDTVYIGQVDLTFPPMNDNVKGDHKS